MLLVMANIYDTLFPAYCYIIQNLILANALTLISVYMFQIRLHQ